MKEKFIDVKFRAERLATIEKANGIIAEYEEGDYRLTLRQLYYQFVSRNWIPNTERSYKNLGETISQGRLAGLIDWDSIEDRVRTPRIQSEFKDLEELAKVALYSYRLPRWRGQAHYMELWVEKDALAGVLEPLASELHVTLMVNRGYSSQSAMYESATRFIDNGDGHEQTLLYLGDHDPSGEDMVRDIQDRLDSFGAEVEVRKIALTREQAEAHNAPPNPAKMSDARAAGYVAKHGAMSWEVDALPPNVLVDIIRGEILARLDLETMQAVQDQERADKEAWLSAVGKLRKT